MDMPTSQPQMDDLEATLRLSAGFKADQLYDALCTRLKDLEHSPWRGYHEKLSEVVNEYKGDEFKYIACCLYISCRHFINQNECVQSSRNSQKEIVKLDPKDCNFEFLVFKSLCPLVTDRAHRDAWKMMSRPELYPQFHRERSPWQEKGSSMLIWLSHLWQKTGSMLSGDRYLLNHIVNQFSTWRIDKINHYDKLYNSDGPKVDSLLKAFEQPQREAGPGLERLVWHDMDIPIKRSVCAYVMCHSFQLSAKKLDSVKQRVSRILDIDLENISSSKTWSDLKKQTKGQYIVIRDFRVPFMFCWAIMHHDLVHDAATECGTHFIELCEKFKVGQLKEKYEQESALPTPDFDGGRYDDFPDLPESSPPTGRRDRPYGPGGSPRPNLGGSSDGGSGGGSSHRRGRGPRLNLSRRVPRAGHAAASMVRHLTQSVRSSWYTFDHMRQIFNRYRQSQPNFFFYIDKKYEGKDDFKERISDFLEESLLGKADQVWQLHVPFLLADLFPSKPDHWVLLSFCFNEKGFERCVFFNPISQPFSVQMRTMINEIITQCFGSKRCIEPAEGGTMFVEQAGAYVIQQACVLSKSVTGRLSYDELEASHKKMIKLPKPRASRERAMGLPEKRSRIAYPLQFDWKEELARRLDTLSFMDRECVVLFRGQARVSGEKVKYGDCEGYFYSAAVRQLEQPARDEMTNRLRQIGKGLSPVTDIERYITARGYNAYNKPDNLRKLGYPEPCLPPKCSFSNAEDATKFAVGINHARTSSVVRANYFPNGSLKEAIIGYVHMVVMPSSELAQCSGGVFPVTELYASGQVTCDGRYLSGQVIMQGSSFPFHHVFTIPLEMPDLSMPYLDDLQRCFGISKEDHKEFKKGLAKLESRRATEHEITRKVVNNLSSRLKDFLKKRLTSMRHFDCVGGLSCSPASRMCASWLRHVLDKKGILIEQMALNLSFQEQLIAYKRTNQLADVLILDLLGRLSKHPHLSTEVFRLSQEVLSERYGPVIVDLLTKYQRLDETERAQLDAEYKQYEIYKNKNEQEDCKKDFAKILQLMDEELPMAVIVKHESAQSLLKHKVFIKNHVSYFSVIELALFERLKDTVVDSGIDEHAEEVVTVVDSDSDEEDIVSVPGDSSQVSKAKQLLDAIIKAVKSGDSALFEAVLTRCRIVIDKNPSVAEELKGPKNSLGLISQYKDEKERPLSHMLLDMGEQYWCWFTKLEKRVFNRRRCLSRVQVDREGSTLLHKAAKENMASVIDEICNHVIALDTLDAHRKPPIYYAMDHTDIVELLLSKGARLDLLIEPPKNRRYVKFWELNKAMLQVMRAYKRTSVWEDLEKTYQRCQEEIESNTTMGMWFVMLLEGLSLEINRIYFNFSFILLLAQNQTWLDRFMELKCRFYPASKTADEKNQHNHLHAALLWGADKLREILGSDSKADSMLKQTAKTFYGNELTPLGFAVLRRLHEQAEVCIDFGASLEDKMFKGRPDTIREYIQNHLSTDEAFSKLLNADRELEAELPRPTL